ncbi:hypothetical protein L1987_82906 [Smallanthus sonchifolius]|uniref:Uncharacterized protein n=1 Tax=Smallanthus sonchifolius TaxID=185202 RepID=A0ACB8YBZ8_9ASTR|nr:hypothetical protein L1987_82906 [Smallanthus sonchifolius]
MSTFTMVVAAHPGDGIVFLPVISLTIHHILRRRLKWGAIAGAFGEGLNWYCEKFEAIFTQTQKLVFVVMS